MPLFELHESGLTGVRKAFRRPFYEFLNSKLHGYSMVKLFLSFVSFLVNQKCRSINLLSTCKMKIVKIWERKIKRLEYNLVLSNYLCALFKNESTGKLLLRKYLLFQIHLTQCLLCRQYFYTVSPPSADVPGKFSMFTKRTGPCNFWIFRGEWIFSRGGPNDFQKVIFNFWSNIT